MSETHYALMSSGHDALAGIAHVAEMASFMSLILLINVITGHPGVPTHFRRLAWLSL